MFLKLDKIHKSYGYPGSRSFRQVLRELDLEVEEGEGLAIIGPSGSGKTTLLNLMGTLDGPDKGSIRMADRELTDLNEKELTSLRNQSIGFVFQSHFLLPQYNVWENILLPTLPSGKAGEATILRAEDLLKKTGIWDLRWQKPARLSGGENQRTAVVRALINKPTLLLADEPTGALDEDNAEMIMELLVKINRETNLTSIVITHSVDLAMKMDRVLPRRQQITCRHWRLSMPDCEWRYTAPLSQARDQMNRPLSTAIFMRGSEVAPPRRKTALSGVPRSSSVLNQNAAVKS